MAAKTGKPMDRAELQQKIVALAWKDEAFRKAFLADPKKQFEERLGVKLPAGLSMTAHAEDADHLYFVIPARPGGNPGELSDTDLERVTGGAEVGISSTRSVGYALDMFGATGLAVNAVNNRVAGGEDWDNPP